MQPKRYFYLIKVQYLGYRLHGWQKQPNVKTVEELITKTLRYVMPNERFKILGTSRTDAMVSAQKSAFELFLDHEPLPDMDNFLKEFNLNLPQDIRALTITEVDAKFNIIQHPKLKQYAYLFSFGQKNHPFCAPLMANFQFDLNMELMKEGAKLFEGKHQFRNYCVRVSEKSIFEREIVKSELVENTEITASFFPKQSFLFHIHSAGFLRHQVRLMMGALLQLGKGELSLEDIENSLKPGVEMQMNYIVPASGLLLNKIGLEEF